MSKQYKMIHCRINGKDRDVMVDVRASLTDMLRNDFRLTSVKKGCEVGECGACNVLINGECFNSCIYLAVWADGKDILTLEGLEGPNNEISDIQQAFIDEAAVQCGFCTPGVIMSAVEILNEGSGCPDICAAAQGMKIFSAQSKRPCSKGWRLRENCKHSSRPDRLHQDRG